MTPLPEDHLRHQKPEPFQAAFIAVDSEAINQHRWRPGRYRWQNPAQFL